MLNFYTILFPLLSKKRVLPIEIRPAADFQVSDHDLIFIIRILFSNTHYGAATRQAPDKASEMYKTFGYFSVERARIARETSKFADERTLNQ